jgi:hypothetical protein
MGGRTSREAIRAQVGNALAAATRIQTASNVANKLRRPIPTPSINLEAIGGMVGESGIGAVLCVCGAKGGAVCAACTPSLPSPPPVLGPAGHLRSYLARLRPRPRPLLRPRLRWARSAPPRPLSFALGPHLSGGALSLDSPPLLTIYSASGYGPVQVYSQQQLSRVVLSRPAGAPLCPSLWWLVRGPAGCSRATRLSPHGERVACRREMPHSLASLEPRAGRDVRGLPCEVQGRSGSGRANAIGSACRTPSTGCVSAPQAGPAAGRPGGACARQAARPTSWCGVGVARCAPWPVRGRRQGPR